MSLLFLESFDHGATSDLPRKWSALLSGTTGTVIPVTVASGAARTGVQGLRQIVAASECTTFPSVTLAPGTASGVLGVAVRLTTGAWTSLVPNNANDASAVFEIRDAGVTQIGARINTDGTLSIVRGAVDQTSPPVLGTTSGALGSTWTYVEAKWTIHDTTGSCEVRFNGTPVLTLTGVDTKQTTGTAWQSVTIGRLKAAPSAPSITVDFDDVYICDQSGALNSDFLGDVRIDAYVPIAAGTTSGWTRSTGADQWATIDDTTPNDDTDYNSAATAGLTDTLNFPSLTTVGSAIFGLQVACTAKKLTAGGGAIGAVVRSAGADYVATGQGVSTDYTTVRFPYNADPATAVAWTESGFNSAEFGFSKTS